MLIKELLVSVLIKLFRFALIVNTHIRDSSITIEEAQAKAKLT